MKFRTFACSITMKPPSEDTPLPLATSRRDFLKSTTLLAAALPLLRPRADGADAPPTSSGRTRGLLFDAADVPRIRANLELPRFRTLRESLLGADLDADTKFLREELRLNDHIVDLARAYTILERAAFTYAVLGDQRRIELARLALRRLMDYERWDYFLEGGTETIGIQRASATSITVCCALDWLGDTLGENERAEAEHQLATKGAPACYLMLYGLKYPDRVRGWTMNPSQSFPVKMDLSRWPLILNATNLKTVPTAALGIVATWLHGRHPEAEKWLQMARQSAQAFAVMYGLDGAYDEGAGYWSYTTMHLALLAEVLHRRLGIDDRELINYPGTMRFALSLAMPTLGAPFTNPNETEGYNAVPKGTIDPRLDLVNFGDSGLGLDVSVAPWVGRVADDPLSNHVANTTGDMKDLRALIWYRPDAPATAPGPELHDVRFSNDWVVSRTGWRPEDCVVAFRSGGPANHEHADRNSVIFKAHGERLFHDPFKASYNYEHPRWLLRQTEAHTAVLVGGRGHQYHDGSEGTNSSWAWARIIGYETGADWMHVTSDATDAYQLVNPDIKRVERTLVYLKPDILLIFDRIELTSHAAAVQVRFQVFNEDTHGRATAEDRNFRIHRPHASLQARVAAVGRIDVKVAQLALPAEEGVFPFVEVESADALSHTILTVATAAPAGETHGAMTIEQVGDAWRVTGDHRGRRVSASISAPVAALPSVAL